MNTKGWIGALCLACGLGMEGYAQEPLAAVKVGYSANIVSGGQLDLNYEHALIIPGSIQLELGGMRNVIDQGVRARYLSFHGGIDFRFYVGLRRGRELSGVYLGPFVSYHRALWDYPDDDQRARLTSCFCGGLKVGYQHAFGSNWRLDGGLRMGYGYPYRNIYYPPGRAPVDYGDNGQLYLGLYLKVGYAF